MSKSKRKPKQSQAGRASKRGRPEKLVKIDDSPRNVARALFGQPSDKFTRSSQ